MRLDFKFSSLLVIGEGEGYLGLVGDGLSNLNVLAFIVGKYPE